MERGHTSRRSRRTPAQHRRGDENVRTRRRADRGGCEEEWRGLYLGELVGEHDLGVHGRGGF